VSCVSTGILQRHFVSLLFGLCQFMPQTHNAWQVVTGLRYHYITPWPTKSNKATADDITCGQATQICQKLDQEEARQLSDKSHRSNVG
jgi:hypothetical protein